MVEDEATVINKALAGLAALGLRSELDLESLDTPTISANNAAAAVVTQIEELVPLEGDKQRIRIAFSRAFMNQRKKASVPTQSVAVVRPPPETAEGEKAKAAALHIRCYEIYFLLINLLAVGCVETPPTGVGSLGKSGDITDASGATQHWYMTPSAVTDIFNWALEVCSINIPLPRCISGE